MRTISVIFTLCMFFLGVYPVFGQQKTNIDSLYSKAQEYAKAKKYDKAEKICNDILLAGENGDARFYLGLLYSWDGRYDDARRELKAVHQTRPMSEEVVLARANNELWSDNPLAALEILDKALAESPDNVEFLYLKAKALADLERYDEAIAVLEHLLKIDPANEKAKALLESLRIKRMKNALMLDYIVDFFDNQDPWHLLYLQYSRKTPAGTFIGRTNYAYRFDDDDFQVEADAYLNTGKSNYLYLNAGVSSAAKLFPELRTGAEWYQGLPKSFEASLGFRYLKFTSSDVMIYTGSIAKYWKDYWFSARPFITPSGNRVSYTGVFQVRRYFGDPENYLGLQYCYGSSPDDIHTFLSNADKLRLNSNQVKITVNHRFARVWIWAVAGAYEREEYYPSLYRNKYTIDLSLKRIF
jgi:YaiO family outer membrane protein